MSARPLLAVALALSLACSAAGGAPPAFGTTPFATVSGASGVLTATMYSAPDPIARVCSLRVVITDQASGAAADGLAVTVVPWMPAMGHGASTAPTVTDEGAGVYLASNVILAMPGEWQLRVQATGAESDSFVATVDVP